MNSETTFALLLTAGWLGFFHTVVGPDHYLPFIVMSKANNWSRLKTMTVTFLCGIGHVASSVVIGLLGVAIGTGVTKLEIVEGIRGNIAAWLLIGFGLAYAVWGLHRAWRNKPHSHVHAHSDSTTHSHDHAHCQEHVHVHKDKKKSMTPWILFTIFVFGPCEPLIPVLMFPAAKNSFIGVLLVAGVFAVVTIATMMLVVLMASWGVSFVRLGKIERYSHAIAGGTICLSGLAIQVLNL